jgi:hypothetical protein
LAEIHKIRKKQYYETKGMTEAEEMEYFNKKTEHLKQKYGLKLRTIG